MESKQVYLQPCILHVNYTSMAIWFAMFGLDSPRRNRVQAPNQNLARRLVRAVCPKFPPVRTPETNPYRNLLDPQNSGQARSKSVNFGQFWSRISQLWSRKA